MVLLNNDKLPKAYHRTTPISVDSDVTHDVTGRGERFM